MTEPLVLRKPDGVIVDFRSWPVKAFNPDFSPNDKESAPIASWLDEAVRLTNSEIAELDAKRYKLDSNPNTLVKLARESVDLLKSQGKALPD
jgi:hypothetical protein